MGKFILVIITLSIDRIMQPLLIPEMNEAVKLIPDLNQENDSKFSRRGALFIKHEVMLGLAVLLIQLIIIFRYS